MPRLNGRASIMRYLGYSPQNNKRWQKIRSRYASALYWDEVDSRWWTVSDELDRVDRARSINGNHSNPAANPPSR